MANSADLTIIVDAIASGMRRELQRAEGDLRRFSGQADRELAAVDKGFARLGQSIKGMIAGVSVAAAVSGLTSLTKSALQAADEIDKASRRAGVSSESWQRLAYAARLSGVEASQLEGALRQLNQRLAAGKVEGDNLEDALRRLADRLAAAETGHERVALAAEAGGEEMTRLIPMLADGADGLNRMTAEASEFGQVMSGEAVTAAADFGDQIDKLNGMLRVQFQEGLIRGLTQDTRDLGDVMSDPLVHEGIQTIGALIGGTAAAAIDAGRAIGGFVKSVKMLADGDWDGFGELMTSEHERRMVEKGDWSGSTGFLGDTSRGEGLKIELTRPAAVIPVPTVKPVRVGGGGRVRSARSSAIKQAAEDSADFAQVLREVEAEFRDAQRVFESTRTPMERYGAEVRKLDSYLQSGMISQETYSRALVSAMEDLDSASASTAQVTDRAAEAAEQLGLSFSSALEDAIVAGKGLREILDGLLQDILRITVRMTVTQPLAAGLTSLIGNITGSLFGGPGALMAPAGQSNPGAQMAAIRGAFADGGWVKGFGGPKDDNILALLSPGEFVVDAATAAANKSLLEALPRFRDGGFVGRAPTGGGLTVENKFELINQSSVPLKAESAGTERGPDGRQVIKVIVRDAVEGLLKGGELDNAMRTRYGARPQPIQR